MEVADASDKSVAEFITRWVASEGAERANFQPFAIELCDLLGVARPAASVSDADRNPYAFERAIKFKDERGNTSDGRIDLYKKDCFVLEAKQSRLKDGKKAIRLYGQSDLLIPVEKPRGSRDATRAWDTLMMNARRQAEDYAKALPEWPPFILVCDVGHCIEVYADFSGQGKNYVQFPDRNGYRIYLDDLHDDGIRERLRLIWQNPYKLDPTRQSVKVTREIASSLALVSKELEARHGKAEKEDIAQFLMRCLFTMFAEDVKLLPEGCFTKWLSAAQTNPDKFEHELTQLWQAMDGGGYATIAEQKVKRFNGSFFKKATVFNLRTAEIAALHSASKADWKLVDPAIFGTLLEQALDRNERAALGAHYTPRAYVERVVLVTIIEPLRQEWANVQATTERLRCEAEQLLVEAGEAGRQSRMTADDRSVSGKKSTEAAKRRKDALNILKGFHNKLCQTRVLDPACGTGNFLYVSMELMKRLEGDVLEAILSLEGQEGLQWLASQTVDPHQFLGLEKNERAAAIAELVVWLGFLQWHFRTKGRDNFPPEPILHDFKNIRACDALLDWDNHPITAAGKGEDLTPETPVAVRRRGWPEADFIVGNPPFIGGKDLRANLGSDYTETLWKVYDNINDSADFVMYWWDRAAELLTAKGTKLRRFGFVTTNSITQVFSRRVVANYLEAKKPVSILMAIPDHPWTKATVDHASVRIAMTVVVAGRHEGVLREVTHESGLDTDAPQIELDTAQGRINSDLTVGPDVTAALPLLSNDGLSSPGVKLHGDGFIVTYQQALLLGLDRRPGLNLHIRTYRNGRDLMAKPRGAMVIDLFGLDANDVRKRFPEVYQHVADEVRDKTIKDEKTGETKFVGRKWNNRRSYRENWWIFGEPRKEFRPALFGLRRYIATVETSKHRVFQFLDGDILPDNMLIVIGSDDAFHLGVLMSRPHVTWALTVGGTLEDRPRYNKSVCFDTFAFPDCSESLKDRIRAVAEELDAHRKDRQAENSTLTLTEMYNVLDALQSGEELDEKQVRIKQQGLVLILKELHDRLDALVLEAYGWTDVPTVDAIIDRLVKLNAERKAEEARGVVRWLRPDYQIIHFGSEGERARIQRDRRHAREATANNGVLELQGDDEQDAKPKFPTGDELAETTAVMSVLATAAQPVTIGEIARKFSQGGQIEKRVGLSIMALARLGHITIAEDDAFLLRKSG